MMPFVMDARPDAALEKSEAPSALPLVHWPLPAGRLRPGGFDHPSTLPAPGMEMPFGCEERLEVTVDVDEFDDVDDTDDEELVR